MQAPYWENIVHLLAQAAASGLSIESIVQLTGMGGFASVLLYATLAKAKEQDKAFRSLSITLITIQQSLLIYTMSGRQIGDNNADECKRLLGACDELKRVLEQQRTELEKQYSTK